MLDRYSIFASVGNATQPFDRFLRIVDEAAGRTGLRTLIQTGSGKFRPQHAEAASFVTRELFEALMQEADYVVTHGGVGSVMAAIRLGKMPIVVPRRKAAGEHVNDHQLELADELSRMGWCRIVSDVDELIACLRTLPQVMPLRQDISNRRMREMVNQFIS